MAAEISKPDFSFQWASGGAIVAPSDVKIQTGWTAEVPPFQWENFAQNRQDNAILHLFQKGISEWDAASNYYFTTSGVRSYVQGSDGQIYVALQDSLNQNPISAPTFWAVAFPTSGRLLNIRLISTTSTYVETVGTKNVFVRVQGAGGAGGGIVSTATGNTSAGLGGSAGSYVEGFYPVATLSGLLVTIGTGGVGVAGAAGGNGTTTSFGGVITAPGGVGGNAGQNLTPPWLLGETGNSAIGSGGNLINSRGTSGGQSFSLNLAGIVSGRGGSSAFGAGGNQVGTIRSAGNAGTGPGAGGSGALEQSAGAGGLAGGNGGTGIVEVWEFA